MEDLHNAGGLPAVLRMLLDEGMLHGDCLTVTGNTLAENLKEVAPIRPTEDGIIRPLSRPLKSTGHICILRGNLAPEGSVGNNFNQNHIQDGNISRINSQNHRERGNTILWTGKGV